ncbi:MAG TPA: hypothetical protein VLI43_05270 [Gemmatimonadaceae bacterium]|nr:hypothetical protein [Gemmatimonadaceae bacterium]
MREHARAKSSTAPDHRERKRSKQSQPREPYSRSVGPAALRSRGFRYSGRRDCPVGVGDIGARGPGVDDSIKRFVERLLLIRVGREERAEIGLEALRLDVRADFCEEDMQPSVMIDADLESQ